MNALSMALLLNFILDLLGRMNFVLRTTIGAYRCLPFVWRIIHKALQVTKTGRKYFLGKPGLVSGALI